MDRYEIIAALLTAYNQDSYLHSNEEPTMAWPAPVKRTYSLKTQIQEAICELTPMAE